MKDFSDHQKTHYARQILTECGIDISADFFTLPSHQVQALLDHPANKSYRKPKNANGSRGRYLYAKLVREATGTTVPDIQAAFVCTACHEGALRIRRNGTIQHLGRDRNNITVWTDCAVQE